MTIATTEYARPSQITDTHLSLAFQIMRAKLTQTRWELELGQTRAEDLARELELEKVRMEAMAVDAVVARPKTPVSNDRAHGLATLSMPYWMGPGQWNFDGRHPFYHDPHFQAPPPTPATRHDPRYSWPSRGSREPGNENIEPDLHRIDPSA